MTLDEAINKLESNESPMANSNIHAIMVVLKELRIHKKALELACDDVRCVQPNTFCRKCPLYSDDDICFKTEVKQNYYLQKAREE